MEKENKEYYDQLHAYALGCLDKDDIINLRNFIHSGEKYNWQELGEYQNLAALLPSILNMETPEPQLKDKVARKLYRIRDEIRAKRSNDLSGIRITDPHIPGEFPDLSQHERLNFETGFLPEAEHIEPDEPKETTLEKGSSLSKTREFEIVTSVRKTSEFFRPLQGPPVKEPVIKKAPDHEEIVGHEETTDPVIKSPAEHGGWNKIKETHKENPADNDLKSIENSDLKEDKSRWAGNQEEFHPSSHRRGYTYSAEKPAGNSRFVNILIVIFIAVIGAGIYAFLNITSEVETYKSELDNLKREMKNITANTAGNDNFTQLQRILNLQGTNIINLSGVRDDSFGKAIINMNEGKGFLNLSALKSLRDGRAYQLWIKTSARNFISLGLFREISSDKYYTFDLPEINEGSNVILLLTEEPAAGSERPGDNIHLSGTL
ncbi:MAG: anti-sigma factor [Ignavibacteriaceae bacterium]